MQLARTAEADAPAISGPDTIWVMSADSHFLEPDDLYLTRLRSDLASRAPRSERTGANEVVYIDGKEIHRRVPVIKEGDFEGMTVLEQIHRAPGAHDVRLRLKDLDAEGIWGELVFPSLGMWNQLVEDPQLVKAMVIAGNDWAMDEIQAASSRFVVAGSVPLLDITDAVAEVARLTELGCKAIFLPTQPPEGRPPYHLPDWEPLWSVIEEAGLVLAVHIGTDNGSNVVFRGPGGALLNYVETSRGGQTVVCQLVASGALERHPNLRVLIAEGGASWVPFIADRLDESARQHPFWMSPKLELLPSEYIERQVFASFQHDRSAIPAYTSMGYRNVMWGSDYPHSEGTFGHTQETLQSLFDGVDEEARYEITIGNFLRLFPTVGLPPSPAP
jgi:predicted TIM-barrel fold metal-dependent hydrolase